ncbi:MAG: peptide deformylase [Rhizomicrobium sp.]
MTIREILIAPDPRLKTVAQEVKLVDDSIRALADDMLQTMYDAHGIGLAAVQIGEPVRMVVIDVDQKDEEGKPPVRNPRVFINPKLTPTSEDWVETEEGCLSVPDIWEPVERPATVHCEYLDRDGKPQTLEADGMLAICLQHEVDHLNGTLFIDHLSRLKRTMLLKKLAKAKKLK